MKKEDFGSMSIDYLWALHEALVEHLSKRIVAETKLLEERLAKLKISSFESHLGDPAAKRRRALKEPPLRRTYPIVTPKFRNPGNPAETWAGRGKTPRWLSSMLQSGRQIDDFRITEEEALELT